MGDRFVTLTAQEANSTIGLVQLSTNQTLEYSTDNLNWNNFTTANTITLSNIDDVVYIRGMLNGNNTPFDYTQFVMTGKIAASGNCNALWDYNNLNSPLKERCGCNLFRNSTGLVDVSGLSLGTSATTLANQCYNTMFAGCTSLTTAPTLPATTLTDKCYIGMFQGCSNLTTAPELPATTLADGCYVFMFKGCSNLTTAPELPATTLANQCYIGMFQGCSNLTTEPELPATTLANQCYIGMFQDCSSLISAPELPATTLVNQCYNGMFYGCTSLTTAPELPATTLADGCYNGMFYGCSNLNYIKCLATDISASGCTENWVSGVSSTGAFVKHPDISESTWGSGVNGIPEGWDVIEDVEPLTPEDIANEIMQEVDIFAVSFNDLYETCLSVYLEMGYSVDDFDEVYAIIQSTPNLHDDEETFVISNDSNEKLITVDNNGDFYLKGVGGYDGKNTKVEDSNIKPLQDVIDEKYEALVAGENIQINGNVISATDTTYIAGDNIQINDNVISATDTTYTAGNNVQINDNVISATDTTYTASDFDIKDLSDSEGLRSKWDSKQNALTAGNNIDITNNVITSKGYTYNNSTITTDGSVQVQNNLDIVSPTGGTPTLKLQRGSTDDSYTDFLIYGQSGNLKIDKSTSGTQTNLFNLSENGEVTVNGATSISGGATIGGATTIGGSTTVTGKITADKLYSNIRLYNAGPEWNNPYFKNLNTVGWYKVAELNWAVGINGTLRIATRYNNIRPESYIVNFAEAWDDENNGYAVNAMIFGDGPRNNANALIDKIGFIKGGESTYTLSIYIHYNTTNANGVIVALEAGDDLNGTTLFVPTYDSTKTDSSFGYVYKTKSGLNLKGFNHDFVTFNNELNLADVTNGNTLYVNYRGSTNPINEYKFCKGIGNQSTYSDIRCGTLYQTSDITKKNVIGDLDLNKAYDLIDKCQTIIYTLKDDELNKEQIGVIAQEIQKFFPEIVSADEDGYLALDYSRLTVVILKVLKDIIKRVQRLENKE